MWAYIPYMDNTWILWVYIYICIYSSRTSRFHLWPSSCSEVSCHQASARMALLDINHWSLCRGLDCHSISFWLVVEPPTPLKNDGVNVSWDDFPFPTTLKNMSSSMGRIIPYIMEKIKNFQTTKQSLSGPNLALFCHFGSFGSKGFTESTNPLQHSMPVPTVTAKWAGRV